ncbi:phytanoyl-CoA dioxygenase family protein [Sedimentitalea todarodis]|uniref:Phytanoyl-CoA dioxygenase family protein n=1 Tax=Sedimentitalea todarodis TaxID=1631240 RepID=A0ABU3VHI1_9RHOB|nr:phytanoyl-CoA dioxygenase family protein [Sedimentitalea todarodis]MDU9005641.1 phytanoyl-CoA dioxygenase family protein [Sedimentitalea todarodis]
MLTQLQRDGFARDGYLVVENVLDASTVLIPVRQEYAQLLDDLYDGWVAQGWVPAGVAGFESRLLASYAAGCDWFQPMDISLPGDRIAADTPMHFGPAVFAMLTNPRLLDLVEDLIGPEITSNPIQHVRIKPPVPQLKADEIRAHVGGTDWHQDRAVALEEADQTEMVTIWIAITDATPENGCLQVMPRSHDRMLPHCPKVQTAIADGHLDDSRAVPVPVGAGGVVVLDPLLPHASLPNLSDGIRWSFDLRYNRSGQPTGRAHFPEFVARSAERPQAVLADWKVWREMWLAARARLATQPHIDIHRWQSDSPSCA